MSNFFCIFAADLHKGDCPLYVLSKAKNISEFQHIDKQQMRTILALIREQKVAIARLSRLTGISEGVIRNCRLGDDFDEDKFFLALDSKE